MMMLDCGEMSSDDWRRFSRFGGELCSAGRRVWKGVMNRPARTDSMLWQGMHSLRSIEHDGTAQEDRKSVVVCIGDWSMQHMHTKLRGAR
jgi:hypothetical protein